MKGKSLKKLAVMIMVLSYLAMTSTAVFAKSTNMVDNFSILGNIPDAQAVQLSDAEMKDVKGEKPIIWLIIEVIGALAAVVSAVYPIISNSNKVDSAKIQSDMLYSHEVNRKQGNGNANEIIDGAKAILQNYGDNPNINITINEYIDRRGTDFGFSMEQKTDIANKAYAK